MIVSVVVIKFYDLCTLFCQVILITSTSNTYSNLRVSFNFFLFRCHPRNLQDSHVLFNCFDPTDRGCVTFDEFLAGIEQLKQHQG